MDGWMDVCISERSSIRMVYNGSVLALFSALVWSGLVWELSALLDRTRVSTIQ